jgi:hypothetical protein
MDKVNYAVRRNAWQSLGVLMAVQFTDPPVVVPQILLGLRLVLEALAKQKSKENPQTWKALDQAKRTEKMYELGASSKEVDGYLKGFWENYDALSAELKCTDWLLDMYPEGRPSKAELLALFKAISPAVSAKSKPEDLVKIAKKAIKSAKKQA